jgi:hypothetical protein
MVDRNLTSAANNLGDTVTSFDLVSIGTAGAGLGAGLFAGEFAGTFASDQVSGDTAGFLADVGSRLGLGALLAQVEKMGNWSPMISVLVIMAAFGSVSSAVLRIFESLAEMAARRTGSGSSPVSATVSNSNPSASRSSVNVKKVSSTTTSNGTSDSNSSGGNSFGNSAEAAW